MAKSQVKGSKKAGRNKIKCQRYRQQNRRFKNKLRRILKHNGEAAAVKYRQKFYVA